MSKVKEALAPSTYAAMATRGPTYCRDCDNVVESTRKGRPTSWLCHAYPRRFAEGFVDPDWWVENEPFQRCADINRGSCPTFRRARDGQKEIGL